MYKFETLACKHAALVHLFTPISHSLQRKRFMATDVVSSVNNVTGLLFICRLDCPPFSQSSALNPAWKSVIEESLLVL